MMVKPRNFDYQLTTYTDPDKPLTLTDEEVCLGQTIDNNGAGTEGVEEKASFTALTLKFQLPSSSYATMLMREALKEDTSSFKHRQMTQKSEDQLFKGTAKTVPQQRSQMQK